MEGFFPDGGNTGGNAVNSTANKKPRGEQSLRPVTVKQAQNVEVTPETTFLIDGVEVTQVTLVGVIRDINEQSTAITYRVEDGSGSIEVRKWVDQNESPEETARRQGLLPDMYVRIGARLNSFNNRISLMSFDIHPITDFNEITYHLLDAVYSHVKGRSVKNDPMQITPGGTSGGGIHDQVYQVITACVAEEGIHVAQIVQQMAGRFSEADVRNAVEYLTSEGRCYNTVDEEHIRSTDAF
ncbi:hypothetical protein BCR42DRAFT_409168 [Absidia repens]|uniref:Replication protein A C-terminal domain-containing protein n=1 Tax=Absidia repens TaxID=90262 RepID=A0A1X2ISB1_9FUNG|nr:hypothetical protein BCR42DRAFT_409168 [Absidia repens]